MFLAIALQTFGTLQQEWYDLMMQLTRDTNGFTPPVAARNFAYIAITMFEIAFSNVLDVSLTGHVNDLTKPSPPRLYGVETESAIHAAMYFWMKKSFVNDCIEGGIEGLGGGSCANATQKENNLNSIETLFHSRNLSDVSAQYGEDVASHFYNFSLNDGGRVANFRNRTLYDDPNATGVWGCGIENGCWEHPDHDGLQHTWGFNRPLTSTDCIEASQPVDPIPFTIPGTNASIHDLFYNRAADVYITDRNLTQEQKTIAEFWSDDPGTTATPPGHSISIVNQLVTDMTIEEETLMFAMVGVAINDAFISCWRTKYRTNYVRPVDYIQKFIDSSFEPHLITPPFPEYSSGHSVQTAATVTALIALVGNIPFEDRTHEDRQDIDGDPRPFRSLSELSREAALSRLYGGIHYKEAIELGMYQGEVVGKCVIDTFRDVLHASKIGTCKSIRSIYKYEDCCGNDPERVVSLVSSFTSRYPTS